MRGTLASHSDTVVFGGANALLVENQDGEWELLQFADAMGDPVPAGARVIVANTALGQTGISADMLGLALNWRAGPAGSSLGGDDYVAQTVTLRGKARRPLAPVHLRSIQLSNGDWRLSWIRRTRIGGDSWDQADVPLGEEREAYEVDILDPVNGHVRRVVRAITAPSLTDIVLDGERQSRNGA
ncbi:hypothetical protein BJF92_12315 [Rhizobium rhizosphaerae]|uniref:Rcc01698-like C-terminal domain-containing protein n=1 Tax=Xaviernesmea rhizosphaerae TaxID=1672749 RepID=A0A1Q9AN54_9HYPH|nr:hypothetical protein BJF92_12315 [Xaviernesmea rhizosphaerae]